MGGLLDAANYTTGILLHEPWLGYLELQEVLEVLLYLQTSVRRKESHCKIIILHYNPICAGRANIATQKLEFKHAPFALQVNLRILLHTTSCCTSCGQGRPLKLIMSAHTIE